MEEKPTCTAYQKLFEALQKGGLDRICQTASELLGKPVLIVNEELKKVAQAPEGPLGDTLWDAFWHDGMLSPEIIWQLRDDDLMEKSEQSDVPSWIDWSLTKDLPRLVCNVKVDGVIEGYVAVFHQENTYTDVDVCITQLVSQTVGMELQKQQHPRSTSYPAIINAFINDLFQGVVNTEADLTRWERSMGRQLKPPYYVAAVGGDDRVSTTLHYMRSSLIPSGSNIFTTILDGILYILLAEANAQLPYTELIQNRVANMEDALPMYDLFTGVSIPFYNLLDLEIYKYQAQRALMLGKINGPGRRIHSYQELAWENLLSCIKENVAADNYIHPAIRILERYDLENNTEYLKTLGTYVTSMCNPARTLEKLHIHRNTLLYRISKILDLTGLDLNNMKQCALLLNNFYLMDHPLE